MVKSINWLMGYSASGCVNKLRTTNNTFSDNNNLVQYGYQLAQLLGISVDELLSNDFKKESDGDIIGIVVE